MHTTDSVTTNFLLFLPIFFLLLLLLAATVTTRFTVDGFESLWIVYVRARVHESVFLSHVCACVRACDRVCVSCECVPAGVHASVCV